MGRGVEEGRCAPGSGALSAWGRGIWEEGTQVGGRGHWVHGRVEEGRRATGSGALGAWGS